jgi:hypothetical protein
VQDIEGMISISERRARRAGCLTACNLDEIEIAAVRAYNDTEALLCFKLHELETIFILFKVKLSSLNPKPFSFTLSESSCDHIIKRN